jgi:hypothetical protein
MQTELEVVARSAQADPQSRTISVQLDPIEKQVMEVQTTPCVDEDLHHDDDDDTEEEDVMMPVRAFPGMLFPEAALGAVAQTPPEADTTTRKRPRRAEATVPQDLKDLTIENLRQAQNYSEMKQDLQKLKEQMEEQEKKAKALTSDEQELKIRALIRRFAREEWDARHEPRLEALQDRELTADEKGMGRKQLYRKLQQEEHAAWMRTQEAQGKAFTCQRCGKWTAGGDRTHHCFQGGFRGPQRQRNGVWVRDQMFVEQTGKGNVQVGMRPVVDQDRLERDYQRLAAQRAALLPPQSQSQPIPTSQVTPAEAAPPPASSSSMPIEVETAPATGLAMQYQPQCFFQPAMGYAVGS